MKWRPPLMKNSTRYLLSHLATRLGIAAFYSSMHLHPAGCEMPPEQKRTPAAMRWCGITIGVYEEAELCFYLFVRHAQCFKHFLLKLKVCYSH